HEVVYPEREEQLKSLGLASSAIQAEISKVGGRKVILLIDSCKSGGALVAFRGFEERKALRQLARSSGMHIVAAAAQDQFAGEVARLNHGVFTYVVLEALAGKADGSPKDGVVSVREMLSYVENRMPESVVRNDPRRNTRLLIPAVWISRSWLVTRSLVIRSAQPRLLY
ncbi:MAG: hypothetical protein JKY20_11255, partial [Alphaproteobacteria bacterium]|nr:hypothetical protein [Alphaproteobacteria bacterium]